MRACVCVCVCVRECVHACVRASERECVRIFHHDTVYMLIVHICKCMVYGWMHVCTCDLCTYVCIQVCAL